MIEKEIKFRIENEKDLRKRMAKLGIERIKIVNQVDTYFDFKDMKLYYEDKALRLRKEENKLFLTLKGKRKKALIKTRDEISVELNIKQEKNIIKILNEIGLEKIGIIQKRREIYNFKEVEISIDKVKKLGKFLEIEFNGKSQSVIDNLVRNLALSKNMVVKETYPEMLIKLRH